MTVNGIIAEYNPFHNGHQYHLERSRMETGADYNVVVLSSNFTQRGEPAILDKFARAKMALECGADLVLELPIFCSAASAEYFARGGVSILHQLGVVDYLCFGSECGKVDILERFAKILLEEPARFVKDLKSGLAAGHSYPVARNRALMDYAPELAKYENILASPNNILGIEYIKALLSFDSKIKPHTIQRAGANYHDRLFGAEYCSALALREALNSDQKPLTLASQMPKKAFRILSESLIETPPITSEDFSQMLLYKLLMEKDAGFDDYVDVTPELSDRIKNMLKDYHGFSQFCDMLKSKNMTYARISRSLLHILLDDKKDGANGTVSKEVQASGKQSSESTQTNASCLPVPYARVLGFRKDAAPLLTEIKKNSKIPLVTKLADAKEVLDETTHALLTEDLRKGSIYESIAAIKAGRAAMDERQRQIVII
ncbi:MAG: nucleotidyltransferase [Lachnospiraceae bacterium]|nr:nucleotidyltransferase [Lachnospiraceae bacterium]